MAGLAPACLIMQFSTFFQLREISFAHSKWALAQYVCSFEHPVMIVSRAINNIVYQAMNELMSNHERVGSPFFCRYSLSLTTLKSTYLLMLFIFAVLPGFYSLAYAQEIPALPDADSLDLGISKPEIKAPAIPGNTISKPKLQSTDSLRTALRRPKFKVHGTISTEYKVWEWFHFYPMPNARRASEGAGKYPVSAGNIPLSVSFQYTSLKSNYGLNNYFRVAFDANQFKKPGWTGQGKLISFSKRKTCC